MWQIFYKSFSYTTLCMLSTPIIFHCRNGHIQFFPNFCLLWEEEHLNYSPKHRIWHVSEEDRCSPIYTYQQFLQKQNEELSRNFAHYSALCNVMRALKVTNQTTVTPDYGAVLAFELHCSYHEECTIKVSTNQSVDLGQFDRINFSFLWMQNRFSCRFPTMSEKSTKEIHHMFGKWYR